MGKGSGRKSVRGKDRNFFRNFARRKREELVSFSSRLLADRENLTAEDREEIVEKSLEEFLPDRYEVSRGMMQDSVGNRSDESDVVIYNSLNYPALPVEGRKVFFAESVRCVLDVKSSWNSAEIQEITEKTKAVKKLTQKPVPSLEDRLRMVEHDIVSLKSEEKQEQTEFLKVNPEIPFGAIFLKEGSGVDIKDVENYEGDLHATWPDIVLLLEPGIVVIKDFQEDQEGVSGVIRLFKAGKDCLLVFFSILFSILADRMFQYEKTLDLRDYAIDVVKKIPTQKTTFDLTSYVSRSGPLWLEGE